jgi:hypothetical protein
MARSCSGSPDIVGSIESDSAYDSAIGNGGRFEALRFPFYRGGNPWWSQAFDLPYQNWSKIRDCGAAFVRLGGHNPRYVRHRGIEHTRIYIVDIWVNARGEKMTWEDAIDASAEGNAMGTRWPEIFVDLPEDLASQWRENLRQRGGATLAQMVSRGA